MIRAACAWFGRSSWSYPRRDSAKQDKEIEERKVTPQSWLSGGLSLSLLDDRNIGIGILPESEEILVDGG